MTEQGGLFVGNYKQLFDQDKLEEIMRNEMNPKVQKLLEQSEEKMPGIIETTVARIFQTPEIESLLVALVKAEAITTETTKLAELQRNMDKITVILKHECEEAGKGFAEVLTEASVKALMDIITKYKN